MTPQEKRQGERVAELAEPSRAELTELIRLNEEGLRLQQLRATEGWLIQKRERADAIIARTEYEYTVDQARHAEAPGLVVALGARLKAQREALAELDRKTSAKASRQARIDEAMRRIQAGDLSALEELKVLVSG